MKTLILGALAVALASAPAVSLAAIYAYVNTAGEVMTMDAPSATQALTTAPGLHVHSGVMLIDDASDSEVIGDDVPGA